MYPARAGEPTIVPYVVEDEQVSPSTAGSGELTGQTVDVAVIDGATYEIEWTGLVHSTVGGDIATLQIREGSGTGGTVLMSGQIYLDSTDVFLASIRATWTASATGDETFTLTHQRTSGSGNINRYANATAPSLFTVRRRL